LKISKDKIGTYSLQAIIENIITEKEKAVLFESLKDKIFEMSVVNKFFKEKILFLLIKYFIFIN
jgi:hypothetical protein